MSAVLRISAPMRVTEMLAQRGRTLDMLPLSMEEMTRRDADYHFQARKRWIDLNQIDTQRNLRYHQQIVDWVDQGSGQAGVILELGGGVGFDANLFFERNKSFRAYIFSEISADLAEEVRITFPKDLPVISCALDATSLKIPAGEVDVLFMVAAFHHIAQAEDAIKEFDRVVKPGGWIIFGIEPNRLWTGWLRLLKPLYRAIFPQKDHSAGDEEAEGFRPQDFRRIAEERHWKLVDLVPVWFLCGFIHYGLEALYRILRLHKRLVLPQAVENGLLKIDETLLRLPYMDRLAWHYSVRYQTSGAAVEKSYE